MNMQKLLAQAQDMQEKMKREMGDLVETTSVGGNLVQVTLDGHKHLRSAQIDPDLFDLEALASASTPEEVRQAIASDLDMLQDLVVAAINTASAKMDESLREKVGMIASGLPGLL